MPTNAGSVGVDYSIGYYDGNTGSTFDLGDIQNVAFVAQKHDVKNMPYNEDPSFDYIPDGHKMTFTITRTVGALEDLAVQREANFSNGKGNKAGYLSVSINNTDGTTSRYQYTKFVFFLTDHGEVSREKTVTVKGEGMASRKVPIA